MILPYASDNLPARRPIATLLLLVVTFALTLLVVAYGWTTGADAANTHILAYIGIVPDHFQPLALVTYPLFHDSLGHFLVNAFYLWVFGAGIEAAVGRKRFLALYFAGGAIGGLLQWLVTVLLLPPDKQSVPILGASAACAALIGLYAVRYYRASLHFVGLPIRAHVVVVVTLFLLFEIGGGLWNLLAGDASDGVAHWAHIGGFIFGLTCANIMRLADAGERAYLTQDASQAMRKSVPGAAIKKWETLLLREPQNTSARRELARAWMLLGDREQAEQEYRSALFAYLQNNQRMEAAMLYAEMREGSLFTADLSSRQLYVLGSALEDLEQYALAADTLRLASLQNTGDAEAETALLKVISLYVHHLDRREEAQTLLAVFYERYANSAFRSLADDLRRSIEPLQTTKNAE